MEKEAPKWENYTAKMQQASTKRERLRLAEKYYKDYDLFMRGTAQKKVRAWIDDNAREVLGAPEDDIYYTKLQMRSAAAELKVKAKKECLDLAGVDLDRELVLWEERATEEIRSWWYADEDYGH